jgi:hypothetical protein
VLNVAMPLLIIKYVNIAQTDQWNSLYVQYSLGMSIILVTYNSFEIIHRMFEKDIDPFLLYLLHYGFKGKKIAINT